MSNEATKAATRRKGTWLYNKVLRGKGIDLGCGEDLLKKEDFPGIESVTPFDLEDGDANRIDEFFPENHFDFVHSSQNLEHLHDPLQALRRQFKILKPGGYIVASFPDSVLYEKELWPSRFNSDHKKNFSIHDPDSQMPQHVDVFQMLISLRMLVKFDVIKVELVDTNYEYDTDKVPWHVDQTRGNAEAFIEIVLLKR